MVHSQQTGSLRVFIFFSVGLNKVLKPYLHRSGCNFDVETIFFSSEKKTVVFLSNTFIKSFGLSFTRPFITVAIVAVKNNCPGLYFVYNKRDTE